MKGSNWDQYRLLRRLFRITVILAFTATIFSIGLDLIGITMLTDALPLLFIIIAFVSAIPLQAFACPSCGHEFFCNRVWKPLAGQCRHCGLPKWQEGRFQDEELAREKAYEESKTVRPPEDPSIARRAELIRFLTLVLRDDPRSISLQLDSKGWARLDDLAPKAAKAGISLDRQSLADLQEFGTDAFRHFELSDSSIRFLR